MQPVLQMYSFAFFPFFFPLLLLCSDILNGKRRHFCGFPASRIAIPPFPFSLVSPADNRIQDRICSSCSAGLWKAHMNTSKLAGSSWSKSFHELIWHNVFPGFYEAAHFLGSWQTQNWPRFAICLLWACLISLMFTLSSLCLISGAPSKRRYKRREVEQIQKDVRRMRSLNFEHVQKILRAKRLQRQAKTGNNVIKRRPGRPRKQPIEVSEAGNGLEEDVAEVRGLDLLCGRRGDGRTLGMPVLERCDELPGRQSGRPGLTPEPLEFSKPDSVSATIENVVHRARSVPPLAKGGKRRGRSSSSSSRDQLWSPSCQ